MSMYAAIFVVGTDKYFFEGDEPWDVFRELTKVQDIPCLVQMGRMFESDAFLPQLEALEDVFLKWQEHPGDDPFTMDDIRGINVILSIGSIMCLDTAEGYDEVDKLRKRFKRTK